MSRAYGSGVIEAPIDEVWAIMRNFGGMKDFFSALLFCEIEGDGPADQVGCSRVFAGPDGVRYHETLTSLSDKEKVLTYNLVERFPAGPSWGAPGADARLGFRPITMGNMTLLEWSHEFELESGSVDDILAFFDVSYPALIQGVRDLVASRRAG